MGRGDGKGHHVKRKRKTSELREEPKAAGCVARNFWDI